MRAFAYVTAQSPESAVDLVRDEGRFISGGIDLLGEMKDGLLAPRALVNVKQIPGMREIEHADGRWAIGACVTLAELAAHAGLRAALPGLAEAADEVGSPQMRNVATVGGNLAQRSRCWYYRHPDVECLKKGGRRCYARGGLAKHHAILSGCMCLSPCVSNLAIALAALDARVVVQRSDKLETLPVADLYSDAWRNPRAHNSLGTEDLIVRVEVPAAPGLRSVYLQQSERAAFDWALVSCAAAGRVEGGRLRGVRIALGAIAPVPWTLDDADKSLEGREPTDANFARAADLILRKAEPQDDNAYKLQIARTLIRRALARIAG